ncbi:ACP S-malonyltransferase [Shimia thalassica]|uniref:ACP S-malonyltransferase n=1 Tax=Shimia thalassica TaxID=1715693 RepID=UPI002494C7C4|nr:ACP S-malonyltransferase [Shimia thalassica]
MKQTAVVIAPGRGTYNREELGYLARHHGDLAALIRQFDTIRQKAGQDHVSDLDAAARYSAAKHQRGDNASGLIFACAYADFRAIDRDRFDIVAVTGNSMGWYTALTCAGALSPEDGFRVANTMGTLMQEHMIGGQLIYPFVDENWCAIPGARATIEAKMSDINHRNGHVLGLSIDLGGMLVLAGNEAGLAAFEAEMPILQSRYPMRLPGHAGFHTALQQPVSQQGLARLGVDLFSNPDITLVDGRGAIWPAGATHKPALHSYTLDTQVVAPYDLFAAIRVAAREFMPDVFIILGPGNTLGGAVAQSLIAAHWRGLENKSDFKALQQKSPRILAMGTPDQRARVVR